ncbi:MAG: hypothetical protein HYT94_01470 [Parcubacteria group bacterium]|nr:hypothetical protein [Parcubacteria group bacterium]
MKKFLLLCGFAAYIITTGTALAETDKTTWWTLPNDKQLHEKVAKLAKEVFVRTCGKPLAVDQERSIRVVMAISKDGTTVYLQLTVNDCNNSDPTGNPPDTNGVTM